MTTVTDESHVASADLSVLALTAPAEMALFFTLWAGAGVMAAMIMIRRGHDSRASIVLGMALGPLLFVRALDRQPVPPQPVVVHRGPRGSGPVDVLVAVDGGDDVPTAARAVALFGRQIGRLTIAQQVSIEDAEEEEWTETKVAAVLDIELAASFARASHPSTLLVPGRDARALLEFAARDSYDVLVISDATRLFRQRRGVHITSVSVLVLPSDGRDPAAAEPS